MNKHEFEITSALNNHDDLTGYQISKFAKKNFGHTIGFGTLYLWLDRLTKSGVITRTKTADNRFVYKLMRNRE
jgi:DNA-binding PadR family transcriptional regulator